KNSKILAVFVAVSVLSACAQPGGQPGSGVMSGGNVNKRDVGTLAGAIGGGVIGHNIGGGAGQTVATIAGTLLGGAIGNSVGGSLDNADMAAYSQASSHALETVPAGQSLPWKNPQTGNYGSVTPAGYYQNSNGQYCREYTQTIVVGGKKQSGHGTACRQPDGSWKIIE
ncbi:MAG: RT0821/Lpp0805 family surface protein, partial [Rickettsiales bacterium]